jgi:glucose/arabinose dehydrogenase
MRCWTLVIAFTLLACGDDGGGSTSSSTSAAPSDGSTVASASSASSSSGGEAGSGGTSASGGGGSNEPGPDCTDPVGELPTFELELIAEGLSEPVGLEAAPGQPDQLYVVEKGGLVRIIENGVLLPDPFLDLSGKVWNYGEAGLLGLAFHPEYEKNRRFFVHFIELVNDGAQLAEYRRSEDDPNVAEPEMVGGAPLFRMLHASQHVGGALEFSPTDGYLYLLSGDRGVGTAAQDLSSPWGKVLRFDVATTPYAIPPGNMVGGIPELWDYGLRNPWRAGFDLCSGDFYIGDVGESQREEIDLELAGDGNRNFGWPMMEGSECHPVDAMCDPTGLTLPAVDYGHIPHPDSFFVVIGGLVYRGGSIPALRGAYVHSNTSGRLFTMRHQGGVVTEAEELPLYYQGELFQGIIVSLGQDLLGELYFVEIDPGRIYRLVASR